MKSIRVISAELSSKPIAYYPRFAALLVFAILAFKAQAFEIYDATLYTNKPSLTPHGIRTITVVYGHKTYDQNKSSDALPPHENIEKLAKKLARTEKMVVLDYEHWPTQGYRHIPMLMSNNRKKYQTLLDWYKRAAPDVKFGYFGLVPVSNYVSSLSAPDSRRFQEWSEDNEAMREIAAEIDVAFVDSYTYDDSHANWLKSLDAHLTQLRKIYSGEIYLFLWPQYFDHAPTPPPLRLRYIPADIWRSQLEAARQRVNGVVIWGGWDLPAGKPQTWVDDAPWWKATLKFLEESRSGSE
jgi:hypothetical protein